MYHCHLHFYLSGCACRTFEIIKEMPPLEYFSHEFSEYDIPEETILSKADVILANLPDKNPKERLQALISVKSEKARLIILADREQTALLTDSLEAIQDIWTVPMSDEEIRFRFLRWQQTYKMSTDFWQTSQYLESTINSIPNLIWYKTKEGIHEKVNDSFCATVNKTKKQVEGREHFYIWGLDPNDPANSIHDCMESDNAVMEKRETCVSEETVKTGSGTKLLTTYKSPLYDLDGSVMGTVGIGIDITQERAYEQELLNKSHTLEKLFTTLDCGILCHTLEGSRILSVNQAALNILGYESKEELMATGFNMVAPSVMDEDKPKLRACIQELKKDGDSCNIEYRVQHKDGEILHIMGNVKFLTENGESFYQRFLLDCTAQKLQEKKNERHQAELVQALSIDYNLVCFFDLDTGMGNLLRVDDESARIFDSAFTEKISLKESMERYLQELVYEDDKEAFRQNASPEHLTKELAEKKRYYTNYRIFKDNQIKYYEMKVVRAGTWDENHGIVLGFRSVDEETRNEIEKKRLLEDALLEANRANNAKSTFLSNMSHDIRTPMNAIVGFTTLSVTHIDHKEKVREYLDKIMVSGRHLLSLINDVLDMSRIESGKMKLEEAPCTLSDILHGLNNIIQSDINAKQLTFKMDTIDILHNEFFCDKLRLNQVLLNIISNSIKYTKTGGSVFLQVTEKPWISEGFGNYEFCIRDTGIGMSKEFQERIFEPFEREKNSTTSRIEGTGLGLAITKNIVDMMKGTISVKSELNKGTEITISFTFRLNLEKITDDGTKKLPATAVDNFRGMRLLLAEDNVLNQEIAAAILEDAGFVTELAENGQDAVDMLKKSSPGYYQLVLMDVQMPVMDGYEATKAIRGLENQTHALIPILAMTANAFEEDKQKALKCGMNGHIAKPIDVDKLFEALNKALMD